MAITLHDSFAIHPGPWLLDEKVKPYGLSVTGVASHLGVTRAALSPEMAIRFEQAFGGSAATLLRMQSGHDLAEARRAAMAIRVPEPV